MKNLRSRKFLSLIVLALIFAAVLAPQILKAATTGSAIGTVTDIGGGVVASIVTIPMIVLLYVINFIGSYLITLIAFFADIATNLSNSVLTFAAVQIGWKIMISFANLGFVLAIIVIAFATMLRMESYGMKKTLWKLIAAALLVNFSLVIAGSVISVSKMASNIFYNQITENGTRTIGDVLGELSQPQELAKPPSENILSRLYEKAKDAVSMFTFTGQLHFIISLIFQIIMNFFIVLIFLTLIVMFLVRAIALIFLLILSPLAWLVWILPSTEKYWKQWWQEFIRWNIFAPAIMFFIYLAFLTQKNIGDLLINTSKAKEALAANTLLPDSIWGSIINNFIILSFLFGGIYVANKFSIAGGGLAYGWAQGAGKVFGGWARNKGKGFGKTILTSGAKKDAVTGEITTRGQRIASKLSRIPIVRGIATGLSNITSSKSRKKEVEEYAKENLANLSNDAIINQAKAKTTFLDNVKASAIGQELAKRNLTDQIDPNLVKKYIATAEKLGADEPIITNRPDLVADVSKTMRKVKAGKVDEINHNAFKNIDVVVNLDPAKLDRLGKEGSIQQKDIILNTIETTLGVALAPIRKVREDIKKTSQEIADAQAKGDHVLVTRLITHRDYFIDQEKILISGLGVQEKTLLKHHDFISNNPNWQA